MHMVTSTAPISTKSTAAEPSSPPAGVIPDLCMSALADLVHGIVEQSLQRRLGNGEDPCDQHCGHERDHHPARYVASLMVVPADGRPQTCQHGREQHCQY